MQLMRATVAIYTHTMQYLSDVDCPLGLEPGGTNLQAVLQWLLNYAVSLEYADAGVKCSHAFLHNHTLLTTHTRQPGSA